jgi:diguanylate cyclase (GGDEF)-like protein/PAS domain S-box-containing protein
MKPLQTLAATAALAGSLALGWLATQAVERNEGAVALLGILHDQIEAQERLREETLRLRYGLAANYDALAGRMAEIGAAAERFAAADAAGLSGIAADYRRLVESQRRLAEDFKFRNAVTHNSLRYFQYDAVALLRRAANGDMADARLRREILLLVNAVQRLALEVDFQLAADVRTDIERVRGLAARTDGPRGREIARLLAHAAIVERHLPVLDTLTLALSGKQAQEQLTLGEGRLRARLAEEAQRATRFRAVLAAATAALLLGLALLGVRHAENLRRRLDDARELSIAGRFFEDSEQGLVITDARGTILRVNPAMCRITGYAAEELVGNNPRMLKSGLQDEGVYREMWQSLAAFGAWQGELYNRRKNGETYVQWLHIDSVRAPDRALLYVGLSSDVTEIHAARERVEQLAYYDVLTGLPNRTLFLERLRQAIARAKAERTHLAVMLLDLDHFAAINDSLGHAAGDAMLREAGRRIAAQARDEEPVARLGGDEFGLLLTAPGDNEEIAELAQRLIDQLALPCHVEGFDVVAGAGVGVTVYPRDGDSAEQLLRNADSAMNRAKKRGRNAIEFYARAMTADALEALRIQSSLRGAIEASTLRLHYQPKVTIGGELVGVEALLRWEDEELGLVPPARFIELAERMGLIGQLGGWVLVEACRQLAEWRRLMPRLEMAINLSPLQFRHELVGEVAVALARFDLPGTALELEITEGVLMGDAERTRDVLDGLKGLGCRLAVDDFGTGYSSLSYLKRLPVDVLKIDKSFVEGLGTNANDTAVVRAIVALAESLDLAVVAEGVETVPQFEALRAMDRRGDMLLQGFALSRPLVAADVEPLLRSPRALAPH